MAPTRCTFTSEFKVNVISLLISGETKQGGKIRGTFRSKSSFKNKGEDHSREEKINRSNSRNIRRKTRKK